jgi:putative DNA primase/helicase
MDGNQALIGFLQRAISYSLTGSTRERVTFFLHGGGANGKTTLVEAVGMLMGDYAETTRTETLLVSSTKTTWSCSISGLACPICPHQMPDE